MTETFIEITPRDVQVFRIEDLDLDAPCSLDLLSRPQRAQRVGWEPPADLLALVSDDVRIPIKAPGTPVFIPAGMAPCGAFQKIIDFRHASSLRYEHEWMFLTYDRNRVMAGDYVRLNAGKHIDENEENLLESVGRVSANFLMASSFNTVFYDGLHSFCAEKFMRHQPGWARLARQDAEEIDPVELARVRNAFFDSLVYPAEGRNWPAGTITCSTGVTTHEIQKASQTHQRAFLHIACYEGQSLAHEESRLRKSNPPLARAVYG